MKNPSSKTARALRQDWYESESGLFCALNPGKTTVTIRRRRPVRLAAGHGRGGERAPPVRDHAGEESPNARTADLSARATPARAGPDARARRGSAGPAAAPAADRSAGGRLAGARSRATGAAAAILRAAAATGAAGAIRSAPAGRARQPNASQRHLGGHLAGGGRAKGRGTGGGNGVGEQPGGRLSQPRTRAHAGLPARHHRARRICRGVRLQAPWSRAARGARSARDGFDVRIRNGAWGAAAARAEGAARERVPILAGARPRACESSLHFATSRPRAIGMMHTRRLQAELAGERARTFSRAALRAGNPPDRSLMSQVHVVCRQPLLLAGVVLVSMLATTGVAHAGGFGEIRRFGAPGDEPGKLTGAKLEAHRRDARKAG